MGKKRIPQISSKLVKRYIALDKKLDSIKPEYNSLKDTLRGLHESGYVSPLLTFIDKSVQNIDWQKIAKELMAKYMLPPERRVYMRNVKRRFPRKPIACTIQIVGKERKRSKESSC